jgi:hypothetical protein
VAREIDSIGAALFRRVYRRCAEIARGEIRATFGQAWRGGKFQWPFLLAGHGYELTQAANGYDSTHAVITVAPGATTATQHVTFDTARPYVSGSTPVVLASSGDGNWLATWSNVDDTGFDLTVTAIPATISGEHDVAIASGSNSGTQAISFGVTFTASPVVEVEVVDDPSGSSAEADYQPSIQGRSTTGFTAKLVHFPINNAVQTSDNATLTTGPTPDQSGDSSTDTTGMHGVGTGSPVSPIETNLAYSKVAGANGTGGDGNTSNNSDGTDTGDSSRSPNTADQSQGHQHPFTGSPTGDEDRSHHHDMSHTHPHNNTTGNHTHPVPDAQHKHDYDDHVHNLNNHHHTLSDHTHSLNNHHHTVNMFPNEPSTRHLTLGWTATGIVTAAGGTVPVSWLAFGPQSL